MNKIERLEQICLSILADNPDPWIPMDVLIEKCKEISGDEEINESLLGSFLFQHPEVKIFTPFFSEEPAIQEIFQKVQIPLSPIVILKKRIPREKDMFIWMYNHLTQLMNLLKKMENESTGTKRKTIQDILERANTLQEKIKERIK